MGLLESPSRLVCTCIVSLLVHSGNAGTGENGKIEILSLVITTRAGLSRPIRFCASLL